MLQYACEYNMVKTARVLIMSGNANVQFRNSETGIDFVYCFYLSGLNYF